MPRALRATTAHTDGDAALGDGGPAIGHEVAIAS